MAKNQTFRKMLFLKRDSSEKLKISFRASRKYIKWNERPDTGYYWSAKLYLT